MKTSILFFSFFLCLQLNAQEGIYFKNKTEQGINQNADIEKVVNSVLTAISGPVGQERDWDAIRTAFHPTAKFSVCRPIDGKDDVSIWYVEEFIQNSKTNGFYKNSGFTEKALKNTVMRYGNMAHVYQAYHGTTPDGKVNIRGINSYQLAKVGDSWKIVNLIWQGETKDFPLPKEYGG